MNLKKLKAFDNTVYFSGVPCLSLITAASSAQISEWLLKASADNKQIYDMNLCHYHVNYDLDVSAIKSLITKDLSNGSWSIHFTQLKIYGCFN